MADENNPIMEGIQELTLHTSVNELMVLCETIVDFKKLKDNDFDSSETLELHGWKTFFVRLIGPVQAKNHHQRPKKQKQKEPQVQMTKSDDGDLSPDTTKTTKRKKKKIKTSDALSHPKIKATKAPAKKTSTSWGVVDGTKQQHIKQIIPVSSSDHSYHLTNTPSYHPTSTHSYHLTSPKDSTKESIDEVDKPIEQTQKDHTSDFEHGDEKEKNSPVEGEVGEEM
ncbi:hypothetical protein KIW84_057134 [Lathyrus oleraceus]|uniref:Uncharacterized protein n=1 Tax=Pisum sativum TaxID=3888 RepID=A0A9D4X2C2_PEA|nr:hypothetical protein KIW84_057134 [Pisum sativum]